MTLRSSIKNSLTLPGERTKRDIREGYTDYDDDRNAVCLKGDNGSNQADKVLFYRINKLTANSQAYRFYLININDSTQYIHLHIYKGHINYTEKCLDVICRMQQCFYRLRKISHKRCKN